ncbi:MAG: SCP2 sterol-binding domain-containing protein [Alphaproteobacteria bacterium]|jgi:predicted lipid carrier protein YhbT|nr:SCP2 sterol-binding domain-containing protein [Alphaproteobacteria bacterium]
MSDFQSLSGQGAIGAGRAGMVPPFSPVLLAGLLLLPLPSRLLQPLLQAIMGAVASRHPALLERLGPYADTVFLIDPIDLPIRFLLRLGPERPRLSIAQGADAAQAGAAVRGSLLALIDLLEGRVDGDSLFFSRRLAIEGDTEAVVALRNAVDGEEIDIVDDILVRAGPLARPARLAVRRLLRLARRAGRDMALLQAAILQPAIERIESQAAETERLRQAMAGAGPSRGRRNRASPPTAPAGSE